MKISVFFPTQRRGERGGAQRNVFIFSLYCFLGVFIDEYIICSGLWVCRVYQLQNTPETEILQEKSLQNLLVDKLPVKNFPVNVFMV